MHCPLRIDCSAVFSFTCVYGELNLIIRRKKDDTCCLFVCLAGVCAAFYAFLKCWWMFFWTTKTNTNTKKHFYTTHAHVHTRIYTYAWQTHTHIYVYSIVPPLYTPHLYNIVMLWYKYREFSTWYRHNLRALVLRNCRQLVLVFAFG